MPSPFTPHVSRIHHRNLPYNPKNTHALSLNHSSESPPKAPRKAENADRNSKYPNYRAGRPNHHIVYRLLCFWDSSSIMKDFGFTMWQPLGQTTKEGGCNAIESYVFLNDHEPSPGKLVLFWRTV